MDTTAFARNNVGLSKNDFVIVFTGRLVPEKGIVPLLEAMSLLKKEPRIKLMVLGSPSLGSTRSGTDSQHQIQKRIKNLKNVNLIGYIDYSLMGDYLHLADIAVIPSLWGEPFGLTCIEAMAAGLPVITTKCGGIPEVVTAKSAIMLETGELLTNNLADAILDLYLHPEKRQAMGLAARQRAQKFSKKQYAKNFFKALETIG